jgi:hypothetical protein
VEEYVRLLLNIIKACKEREGNYGIEIIDNSNYRLWVVLGNRVIWTDVKDTKRLKDLWNQIQDW